MRCPILLHQPLTTQRPAPNALPPSRHNILGGRACPAAARARRLARGVGEAESVPEVSPPATPAPPKEYGTPAVHAITNSGPASSAGSRFAAEDTARSTHANCVNVRFGDELNAGREGSYHFSHGDERASASPSASATAAFHQHRAACMMGNLYLYNGRLFVVGDDAAAVVHTLAQTGTEAVAVTPQVLTANLTASGSPVLEPAALNGASSSGGAGLAILWPMDPDFVMGHKTGFGHMLHDAIVPIFWGMELLGLTTTNSQVVVLHSSSAGGPNSLHEYFGLLSSRPPIYADDLPLEACPPDRWCRVARALAAVSHRVLGLYDTKYTSVTETQARGKMYQKFSAFALANLGRCYTETPQHRSLLV